MRRGDLRGVNDKRIAPGKIEFGQFQKLAGGSESVYGGTTRTLHGI